MHFLRLQPMRTRRRRALLPALHQLDDRCLLSGLTPAQVARAYGLDRITFPTSSGPVKGDGSGQAIALIEAYHDPNIASDLQTFDRRFNLPDPTLVVVNQAGAASNAGWALEESLDVEWAHAIAPGAVIVVVEARSQSRDALVRAVNTARNMPNVVAISMSFGFDEFVREASYNSTFTTPARHRGITFVAASGDSGPAGGAEWPAIASTVLAVGGTTLSVSSSGEYLSETAWSDSSGGFGRYQPEPSYQRSVHATGKRSTPDVAFDGDPSTGVAVYQTSLSTGQGSWVTVGGTSLGTPAWAAIVAIVDQGRALSGQGSLDGPTQTMPALYALPSRDFHAIAPLPRQHGTGVNTSTGRGTPVGPALVADLVASHTTTTLTTSRTAARGSSKAARSKRKLRAIAIARVILAREFLFPEIVGHAKPSSPHSQTASRPA
jgi:nitrate reductase NapAB chaperone NapD